jgi:glycosyltransferase involved in cell wall biosynthesis
MLPLISCVCPTIGKVKLLEESIQSFHLQTYPNKELIIFNNFPDVDLVYNHSQVKVVNYKEHIYSIGQCRNVGISYAQGEYIATWDDDDICLKDRLSFAYKNITESGSIGHVSNALYSEANKIVKWMNLFMSSSIIHREFLKNVPFQVADNDDRLMFEELTKSKVYIDNKNIPQYIYRWDTNSYHVSGTPLPVEEQRRAILHWARGQGIPKTCPLSPYWARDYESDVSLFVSVL